MAQNFDRKDSSILYFSTSLFETSNAVSPQKTVNFSQRPSPKLTSTERMGRLMTNSSISSWLEVECSWLEVECSWLGMECSLSLLVSILADYLPYENQLQHMVSSLCSLSYFYSDQLILVIYSLLFCLTRKGLLCLSPVFLDDPRTIFFLELSYSSILMLPEGFVCFYDQLGYGCWKCETAALPYRIRLTRKARYYQQIWIRADGLTTIFKFPSIPILLWVLLAEFLSLWQHILAGQQLMIVKNSLRLLLGMPPQLSPYSSFQRDTSNLSSSTFLRQCRALNI